MERVFFLNLSAVMDAKFEELEKRGLLHSGTLKPLKLAKEVVDDLDLGEGNLGGSADSDDEATDENKGRTKRQKREREDYGGEEEERNEMEGNDDVEDVAEEAADEEKGEEGGDEEDKPDDAADTTLVEEEAPSSEEDDNSDGEPSAKKKKSSFSNKSTKSVKKKPPKSPSKKSQFSSVGRPGAWLKDQVEAVRLFEVDASPTPKWCRCVIVASLNSPRLDLAEIVKTEIKRSVVHKVRGISRGFLVEDKKTSETWLRTEGINIEEFARNEQVSHSESLALGRLICDFYHL